MKPGYPVPEPGLVWTRFFELVCVPRPSKAEQPAIDFLNRWADRLGFEARRDATGNLAVHVPATTSTVRAAVILQSHVDIVSVTASGDNGGADASLGKIPTLRGDLDPDNSKRLNPNDAGDWIIAPHSTLGADNGMGVAMMMALAEATQRPRPLQLLFTIDEEAGMTGAMGLDPAALGLTAQQLINIDTEDDDEITIGAAGGRDAVLTWAGQWEDSTNSAAWTLSIDGLKGGHSGVEINQGRANANRLLARLLQQLNHQLQARVVSFIGGSRRNAIPDTCSANIVLSPDRAAEMHQLVNAAVDRFNQLYAKRDNRVEVVCRPAEGRPGKCLSPAATADLLGLLTAIPTGICEMTPEIPVLVESSCNMAIINLPSEQPAEVICSVRGTTREALDDVSDSLLGLAQLSGAAIKFAEGYSGWKPQLGSPLLTTAIEQYRRLFNSEPKVHAVHAGLECGLLIDKMPGLSAISIGPTIKGNHAVGERVQISSVAKSFRYLQAILEAL